MFAGEPRAVVDTLQLAEIESVKPAPGWAPGGAIGGLLGAVLDVLVIIEVDQLTDWGVR